MLKYQFVFCIISDRFLRMFCRGRWAESFHWTLPDTVKMLDDVSLKEDILVVVQVDVGLHLKSIVWVGESSMMVPLFRNTIPDVDTSIFVSFIGRWASILSTKSCRFVPIPFWFMTCTSLYLEEVQNQNTNLMCSHFCALDSLIGHNHNNLGKDTEINIIYVSNNTR